MTLLDRLGQVRPGRFSWHDGPVASWSDFEEEAPELAAAVRARFQAAKHCTMATLRKDGSPRISGTEVEFDGEDVCIGVMPDSVKGADLQRDSRLALHSPTVDPPTENAAGWPGEAKLAGFAVEDDPDESGGRRYYVEIREAVLTRIADSGEELRITWWRPGEPVREVIRR